MLSYFQKIANYSTVRFILEVTALAFISRFIIVLPVSILLAALGVNLGDPNIDSINFSKDLIFTLSYVVILAPFIETLIFQCIPLTIMKFLRFSFPLQLLAGTLLFAYAHLHQGLINFIGMVPIGFLFVWSFLEKRKQSLINAVFIVFSIHALTNLLATVLYFFR